MHWGLFTRPRHRITLALWYWHTPVSFDQLTEECGLSSRRLAEELLVMEMSGSIVRHPDTYASDRKVMGLASRQFFSLPGKIYTPPPKIR